MCARSTIWLKMCLMTSRRRKATLTISQKIPSLSLPKRRKQPSRNHDFPAAFPTSHAHKHHIDVLSLSLCINMFRVISISCNCYHSRRHRKSGTAIEFQKCPKLYCKSTVDNVEKNAKKVESRGKQVCTSTTYY